MDTSRRFSYSSSISIHLIQSAFRTWNFRIQDTNFRIHIRIHIRDSFVFITRISTFIFTFISHSYLYSCLEIRIHLPIKDHCDAVPNFFYFYFDSLEISIWFDLTGFYVGSLLV